MNVEVFCFDAVAPVRERGLKSYNRLTRTRQHSRSREGAWIEITDLNIFSYSSTSLP